ncbi:MAG: hypothetical protein AAFR61_26465 [Bacteroidota bacterium]
MRTSTPILLLLGLAFSVIPIDLKAQGLQLGAKLGGDMQLENLSNQSPGFSFSGGMFAEQRVNSGKLSLRLELNYFRNLRVDRTSGASVMQMPAYLQLDLLREEKWLLFGGPFVSYQLRPLNPEEVQAMERLRLGWVVGTRFRQPLYGNWEWTSEVQAMGSQAATDPRLGGWESAQRIQSGPGISLRLQIGLSYWIKSRKRPRKRTKTSL